jgi:hypothetical protein
MQVSLKVIPYSWLGTIPIVAEIKMHIIGDMVLLTLYISGET